MVTIVNKLSAAVLLLSLAAGCATNVPGSGTSSSGVSPQALLYAASTSLDQAERIALAYTSSAAADPAVKAQIKALDNTAYNAIHPLLEQAQSGQNVVTAAEAEVAQAALGKLTDYLVANGVK